MCEYHRATREGIASSRRDFRRDHGPAIRQTSRQFVLVCREIGLFEQALVAIDGSKFKAVNNRDNNFTPHKLRARQQQLDESIARYLADLDRADRDPSLVPEERTEHLKEKLVTVRAQMKKLEAIGRQLAASPDQQVSLTDPMHARWRRAGAARGWSITTSRPRSARRGHAQVIFRYSVSRKLLLATAGVSVSMAAEGPELPHEPRCLARRINQIRTPAGLRVIGV